MNTSDDLLLRERFGSMVSMIDNSDWDEVVERAGLSPISRRSRRRQVRLLVAAGIVAFALGVGATIVSGSTFGRSSRNPSAPGPQRVERQLPPGTIRWLFDHQPRGQSLQAAGIAIGSLVGSHWQPVRFARVLRPDPASSARIVVSLIGKRGRNLCMSVFFPGGGVGGCGVAHLTPFKFTTFSGLDLVPSGGFVVAGLASDQVARIELFIANGSHRRVPLRDNAFFTRVARSELPVNLVAYDKQGEVIGTTVKDAIGLSLHG
jgi:hypothetical protein